MTQPLLDEVSAYLLRSAPSDLERDELLRLLLELRQLAREVRRVTVELETLAISDIEERGSIPLPAGTYLYVGRTTTYRSHDDRAVVETLLDAASGDLRILTSGEGCLVAQPWKAASVRSRIGTNKFAALFQAIVSERKLRESQPTQKETP